MSSSIPFPEPAGLKTNASRSTKVGEVARSVPPTVAAPQVDDASLSCLAPKGQCRRKFELRRRRGRRSLPADLSPADLVAVVDGREQNPLDLEPLRQVAGTLATGDYSLRGLESIIAIERKSLVDLLSCIGRERDRFHREVLRLLAYPVRALVVESTWPVIERGQWRNKVRAPAALGTVLNWISMGLPVIMAGDHSRAGRYVSRILFVAARRRWREARALLPPS